jgi:hypothetical protein
MLPAVGLILQTLPKLNLPHSLPFPEHKGLFPSLACMYIAHTLSFGGKGGSRQPFILQEWKDEIVKITAAAIDKIVMSATSYFQTAITPQSFSFRSLAIRCFVSRRLHFKVNARIHFDDCSSILHPVIVCPLTCDRVSINP